MAKAKMTPASQKRMLTAQNSRLARVNLAQALGQEQAWSALPLETRQQLYALLPPPKQGDPDYDVDINPLQTTLRQTIEGELRMWQIDLAEGRETKKWRDEAMEAAHDHIAGKFAEQLEEPPMKTTAIESRESPDKQNENANNNEDANRKGDAGQMGDADKKGVAEGKQVAKGKQVADQKRDVDEEEDAD